MGHSSCFFFTSVCHIRPSAHRLVDETHHAERLQNARGVILSRLLCPPLAGFSPYFFQLSRENHPVCPGAIAFHPPTTVECDAATWGACWVQILSTPPQGPLQSQVLLVSTRHELKWDGGSSGLKGAVAVAVAGMQSAGRAPFCKSRGGKQAMGHLRALSRAWCSSIASGMALMRG